MVDPKRLDKKIPSLITETPWITGELDINQYRVQKFKTRYPDRYLHYRNELMDNLEALSKEVNAEFTRPKRQVAVRGR